MNTRKPTIDGRNRTRARVARDVKQAATFQSKAASLQADLHNSSFNHHINTLLYTQRPSRTMARPASPPTVYPNSSTDHGFMPRREFIREERIPSTFALLTISSSSFIRLYGFPQPLISSIRRLLLEQERLAQGFREDIMQNFCEFVLEGKPWTNPKSIPSEKLLVDILAVFFQHGYAIVSTLDYGREQDDKVCIAFSKPTSYPSNSTIPAVLRSGGSSPSPALPPVKTPFALSFPNATTLRVVSPPLHSTPAILQAVRGAWPRGVESEKKVGDATFEFKFKGYKCERFSLVPYHRSYTDS